MMDAIQVTVTFKGEPARLFIGHKAFSAGESAEAVLNRAMDWIKTIWDDAEAWSPATTFH